jgi:hypothetical protein
MNTALEASKFVFFAIYKYNNHVKEDEMGRRCSKNSNT